MRKNIALAEQKADNISDLHFCYNLWIDLLYKLRDNADKLDRCVYYCKKDIEMFPQFERQCQLKENELHITAFERLAIIYEKQKNIDNAIKINELALSYSTIKHHDKYKKRLEKLLNKLSK